MSRMSPALPHHGSAASAVRSGTIAMAKPRLAFVPRSTRMGSMSVPRAREQPVRAQDQNDQKGDVSGENLPVWIERGPDGLGDAEHHAADERTPYAAEA